MPPRAAHAMRLLPLALVALLVGPPALATSLVGREFRLAWPRTPDVTSEDPRYDLDAELVVLAADGPVSVRVTAPGVDRVVAASPGSPATVRLPRAQLMVTADDVPVNQGIRVAPASAGCGLFAVLLRVPGSGASVGDDIARILPVDLLGPRYLPVAYWGTSEFVVVATQDGTSVTIDDPTCASPPPRTLDAGQALQHSCIDAPGDGSVTGTLVTASAPVALISGSASSTIVNHEGPRPGTRGYWGWADVLLESPWPVDLLGREHVHGPFPKGSPDASGDLIRVVAACDDTSVRVTEAEGTRSWRLARPGDHVDVETPDIFNQTWRLVPGPARIVTDRGALVASFSVGGLNAGLGDPAMSMLDPVDRWERTALAWMPRGYDHSLVIVTEAASTGSVRLDGAPLASAWDPVPGTSFAWTRIDDVADGEHRVTGDAPLFVECMGVTPRSPGAYAYPAIPLRSDVSGATGGLRISGADTCATACPGTCVTLRAPSGFASYAWSVGGSGIQVTTCPDVTTTVTVAATDASGCRFEGSVVLEVIDAPTAPTIDGPATSCAGGCIELTAPAGYDTYSWSTGETSRSITACPVADATYSVTVGGPSGCGGTANHDVVVHGPPVPGDALVAHPDPCLRGLEITWLEPAWRPGSPGGVINVYRREGGCAAVDDPSWTLLAVGLTVPPWRDLTTLPGVTYAYMIEAEDAAGPGPCNPGPAHGGSTGRRCARPNGGTADPGDPDAARLIPVSPHLRALSYERAAAGGPAIAATFAWPSLPPIDPATHLEAWRGTDPRALVRVEPLVATPTWRDADAGDAALLFYKVFNATGCGTLAD